MAPTSHFSLSARLVCEVRFRLGLTVERDLHKVRVSQSDASAHCTKHSTLHERNTGRRNTSLLVQPSWQCRRRHGIPMMVGNNYCMLSLSRRPAWKKLLSRCHSVPYVHSQWHRAGQKFFEVHCDSRFLCRTLWIPRHNVVTMRRDDASKLSRELQVAFKDGPWVTGRISDYFKKFLVLLVVLVLTKRRQ